MSIDRHLPSKTIRGASELFSRYDPAGYEMAAAVLVNCDEQPADGMPAGELDVPPIILRTGGNVFFGHTLSGREPVVTTQPGIRQGHRWATLDAREVVVSSQLHDGGTLWADVDHDRSPVLWLRALDINLEPTAPGETVDIGVDRLALDALRVYTRRLDIPVATRFNPEDHLR